MAKGLNIRRHSFQPGAMSIIQMGQELIGHASTAINELVKNGYDADATLCKIYFYYDHEASKSFAVIFDNGNGMDENTLFGDWLHPSVSVKRKENAISEKFKRHFLGSKGIGRLAAMALGQYVTVITKKAFEISYNWVTVDRELFKQEKLLSEVDFPGEKVSRPSNLFLDEKIHKERVAPINPLLSAFLNENQFDDFSHGTLILVEVLDSAVKKVLEEDFIKQTELIFDERLKRTDFYKSLATLITPLKLNTSIQKELIEKKIIEKETFIAKSDNPFEIKFSTNLIPDQKPLVDWIAVEPIPILSVFNYRIYGKVRKDGSVKGVLEYKRLDNDEYEEEIDISVNELQDSSINGQLDLLKNEPEVGEYYFDIRVYDIGERENLEKLAKDSGLESSQTFRNAFKNFQGLRVSKNGFGVKPYGEEVEDWIGLSKARVQDPGHNVNTNQLVGYVFFYSPQNDKLEEKTNREGFLENAAFFEVKNTLLTIFKNLGRKRYNYRLLHNLGRVPDSLHNRPDFDFFLKLLNNSNDVNYIRKESEKFIKEVSTSLDNLEETLSFSERLAALGSGIELVYHEMAQPLSTLNTTKASLNLKTDKIDESVRQIFLDDISLMASSITILAELRKSLQPAIGRNRAKDFRPYQTFIKVCYLFKSDFKDFDITIKTDERLETIVINDIEYAFWLTFLNIVNNAVYWIKRSERPGEIRFLKEREKIVISNSGPFIREELIDHIFKYGVTTRQEKNPTGLGLAFSQRALSKIGWVITAENRFNGPAFIIEKKDE